MAWYDFYKIFTFAFTQDPLEKKIDKRSLDGAGVIQPDAVPDIRNADSYGGGGGGGFVRLRETQDFIDLSTTTNRQARYKEYMRLLSVAEIEMAMTVFADEACVSGDTIISTVFHGPVTIEWLAKHKKDDRFPVYCYDFKKEDYTIGWAYAPRLVKKSPTVKVLLDDGTFFVVTPDHRILNHEKQWVQAGDLEEGDFLTPFYRVKPNPLHTKQKINQFPRIYTKGGWVHERQFIDEWRIGKKIPKYRRANQMTRLVSAGMNAKEISVMAKCSWGSVENWLNREGFSQKEVRHLAKKSDKRRVVCIYPYKEMDVYDLSVEGHENFATESAIMHNCQRDEDGRVFKLDVENEEVKEELEFLFFHRRMLNLDQRKMWNLAKRLFMNGDHFWEIVINPDNPKEGIYKLQDLPCDSVYRIETTKGKLIEFQQGKDGPDYQSLQRSPITHATDQELAQATAIRFAPEQIIHLRIGDDRKTFYPYGISLIEPARGPAHQLRMMEDAMVVYRLTRAPERRVFYIDVGQLPPFKAEAFMERMKDQFRKKKVVNNRGGAGGASAVDEKWHAPAQDEDYWLPIRPNSNTRIETLPGAQNLGEIDDAVYFRNKLFTALNFPKSYFSSEDPNSTRITLSAQDVKFARLIERLQSYIEDGLWEVADRHLKLRGFPEESYEDLKIKMTPPSDWRELSRAEVITNRINNANSLMGGQMMALFDILTKWMKYSENETNEMISRLKIQKLEDLKLQVLAQNPQLLGVGVPGQGENEMGAEPGGPNPMLSPPGGPGGPPPGAPPGGPEGAPPPGAPPGGGMPPMPPPPTPDSGSPPGGDMMPPAGQSQPLPDPSEDEITQYDLEIQDYDADQDEEDIDYSEVE